MLSQGHETCNKRQIVLIFSNLSLGGLFDLQQRSSSSRNFLEIVGNVTMCLYGALCRRENEILRRSRRRWIAQNLYFYDRVGSNSSERTLPAWRCLSCAVHWFFDLRQAPNVPVRNLCAWNQHCLPWIVVEPQRKCSCQACNDCFRYNSLTPYSESTGSELSDAVSTVSIYHFLAFMKHIEGTK